jgi:hypothetical protein
MQISINTLVISASLVLVALDSEKTIERLHVTLELPHHYQPIYILFNYGINIPYFIPHFSPAAFIQHDQDVWSLGCDLHPSHLLFSFP